MTFLNNNNAMYFDNVKIGAPVILPSDIATSSPYCEAATMVPLIKSKVVQVTST